VCQIAQYARFRDYHKFLREKGNAVLESLKLIDPEIVGRVTIDSAPVLERALAERAGAGFVGKNTLYIDPSRGSFLLLGEIFINKKIGIERMSRAVDHSPRSAAGGCGTCRRCQTHCPTGALDKDYTIDARKCIAYWTIEHRGPIPYEFWPWVEQYIFGCDICQLACPYNRNIQTEIHRPALPQSFSREEIALVANMSQSDYERLFAGTPMTRAKRSGLRRNAIIAMFQMNHPDLGRILDCIDENSDLVLIETKEMILGKIKSAQGGT
jgi:epoxyqueuosine reductase